VIAAGLGLDYLARYFEVDRPVEESA